MYLSWGLSTDVRCRAIGTAMARGSGDLQAVDRSVGDLMSTNYTVVDGLVGPQHRARCRPTGRDLKFDPTVFRPSTGNWHVLKSITITTAYPGWGPARTPINKALTWLAHFSESG
jgi:hypothetical protein